MRFTNADEFRRFLLTQRFDSLTKIYFLLLQSMNSQDESERPDIEDVNKQFKENFKLDNKEFSRIYLQCMQYIKDNYMEDYHEKHI